MSAYADLLRRPGVRAVFVVQLVARLPLGMLGLGLTLHAQRTTGSYLVTGLTMAAFSLGGAVSGPALGRALAVFGRRRVLVASSLACGASLALLARPHWPGAVVVLLAGLTGLFLPPVASAARDIYPTLVPARRAPALFALDASSQELLWMVGPPVVSALAVALGTGAALLLAGLVTAVGGVWFAELRSVRRPAGAAGGSGRGGRLLPSRVVLLCTAIAALLNAACGAVELGVVAATPAAVTGLLLATWSAASLAGGVVAGRRPARPGSLARRLALVAAGAGLAACLSGPGWIAAALVVCGAGIAPAIAVLYTRVSDGGAGSAEAFGWLNSGMMVGAACGSALAGAVIGLAGSPAAFVLGASCAAAGGVVAALAVRAARPGGRPGGPGPGGAVSGLSAPRDREGLVTVPD